jgi:ribonuclease P protein component
VVITERARSDISRLGITVSRRIGGAVIRNRVKRLVREFFRRHHHLLQPPQNVLIIARQAAAEATYGKVKFELARALRIDVAD